MNADFHETELHNRLSQMLKMPKYLELLYQLDIEESVIREKLAEYVDCIKHWPQQYLTEQKSNNEDYNIDKIVDIEENIWAPYFGFKGDHLIFSR